MDNSSDQEEGPESITPLIPGFELELQLDESLTGPGAEPADLVLPPIRPELKNLDYTPPSVQIRLYLDETKKCKQQLKCLIKALNRSQASLDLTLIDATNPSGFVGASQSESKKSVLSLGDVSVMELTTLFTQGKISTSLVVVTKNVPYSNPLKRLMSQVRSNIRSLSVYCGDSVYFGRRTSAVFARWLLKSKVTSLTIRAGDGEYYYKEILAAALRMPAIKCLTMDIPRYANELKECFPLLGRLIEQDKLVSLIVVPVLGTHQFTGIESVPTTALLSALDHSKRLLLCELPGFHDAIPDVLEHAISATTRNRRNVGTFSRILQERFGSVSSIIMEYAHAHVVDYRARDEAIEKIIVDIRARESARSSSGNVSSNAGSGEPCQQAFSLGCLGLHIHGNVFMHMEKP